MLGSFIYEKKAYNYAFIKINETSYTFKISTIDPTAKGVSDIDETKESDTTSPKDDPPEYQFSEFSKDIFKAMFVEQMGKVMKETDRGTLEDKSLEVFFSIQAKIDFKDDEPVTAYLILRRDNIRSYLRSNGSVYYQGRLSGLTAGHQISKVDIEIADGAIKNIKAHLIKPYNAQASSESPTQFLEFKNQYPISISGKFDPEKLADVNLYCYNCNGEKGLVRYIKLSELLIYDIVLENDKEDYSPANSRYIIIPTTPIIELKKEKRSKILNIAAFTDFAGLDQEQPNGLIQIEAIRKINLNTKYRLLFGRRNEGILSKVDLKRVDPKIRNDNGYRKNTKESVYDLYMRDTTKEKRDDVSKDMDNSGAGRQKIGTFIIRNPKFRSPYLNLFGSIEPRLLFSKLEENNRFVDSASVIDKQIDPIQLYQYQLASLGLKLDIIKFSFPQLKLNWNVLNVGAYWFRTRIATSTDSVKETSVPLNSSYLQFTSSFSFNPDSRWAVTLGCNYIRPEIWNKEYKLSSKEGLIQPFFDAYMKTGEDSRLFFRFRWTHERLNNSNNFTQIQMGYSLMLFAK
ncbi:hypothetical protein GFS24_26240 [Chitinophaga sp. SYP-B3965]|uniref:hypothetical protein n=1 Tax=Chitinophaga sp. SYP-B3965 TaxID=2663120 RepID=UPI001299E14F|nr:hypothetical protein [Chitinophaga sp. SYP-B3965]MRG48642.1 hypothetical protein [Chitinophaga sp. SYP-B3965]